jgi:RNA-directed DNA polymerase
MQRRPSPDRQGDQVCATFDLVAPLSHESCDTDTRTRDNAGDLTRPRSLAVSGLIGASLRSGDVDSANRRSTLATATMPGIRTSTTATRTTGTRTTSYERVPSADQTPSAAGLSFESLVQAYFDCRQHKRNTTSALAFEENLESNLMRLYDELVSGEYRIGRTICFVITRPKPREVWAGDFRDRIVHHFLYNAVAPRFYRSFIADSCACIPGRGTLYAAKRFESKVRSITHNWRRPAFYLKCDLANFFVSIDKRILRDLLAARIHEPHWLSLADQILFHDPRRSVEHRGQIDRLSLIPPHKSLFNQSADKGLPIGNLSSQFFANVYLDALDQFIKHRIGARHYIRYVDDFVLLHESPQWLNDAKAEIETLLSERLALRLNPKKTVLQPIERGIDFVGQVIKPWCRTTRRRTYRAALHRVAHCNESDLFETANSYYGLLRQASHSDGDRIRLSRLLLQRGRIVSGGLTKITKGRVNHAR